MKRAFAALASAAVLVALLPATMSAAKPTKYTDHAVEAFCEGPIDGGFALAGANTSTEFGDGASSDVWLDPAVPFEEPPTMTGGTSTVARTEGPAGVVLTAAYPVFDADGVELGDALLVMTLAPAGAPEIIEPTSGKSNHHSKTHGTRQPLEGSATLSLPGLEVSLPECFGALTDIDVFETNPHSFVSSAKGLVVDCFWVDEGDLPDESDDVVASFFALKDGAETFADASLTAPGLVLFGTGQSTVSLSAAAVAATIQLTTETGVPHTAVAAATFTKIGSPFTSDLIFQDGRTKTTEQALATHGTLAFAGTDHSFAMDAEHCRANTFDRKTHSNVSSGPKPGAAPANDTPDGAVRLTRKSKPNILTGSTALEAELPNTTCPEGQFDAMGHTVWYTVIGTGGPITIDTSASDFDTVAAAYAPEGGGLTEVGCTDDQEFVPIGHSLQAVLTFDTEAGVEYYVQVGGYSNFFTGDAEFGRLRISVS